MNCILFPPQHTTSSFAIPYLLIKGRYTLPVFMARVHGRRFWHLWTRAPVHTTRVHGSWTLVVCTGYEPCWKKHCTTVLFFQNAREHGPRSNASPHVYGPWTRVSKMTTVFTGWRFWHPWTWAVNTGACPRYPCSRPVSHGPVVCTDLNTNEHIFST